MNIKKIEKQLKKINQLFDNIKEDGTVSAIEKDLMLSYVRALYEKILTPQENTTPQKEKSTVSNKIKEEILQAEKIVEDIPVFEERITQSNNIADVVMQEVVEADAQISHAPSVTRSEPVISAPVQQAVAVEEIVEISRPQIPEELAELFKFEQVSELSDKLSRSPISDLTKCMGINEKIFTVQELFGGDSALFTRAMETMDKFSSLDQAKDYLVEHVALDQNWGSEGKLKKASNFIKLISRRY